ncbi:hypothetical protein [Colwellia sp. E2M01]|uniref:hypothetical protein n=1 Tax=Colwellia sp. E2M01 TaxID=2841561 RepID=UPI001C07F67F|nr:hypothetical protein [Colwellia sp. E2M01]MBU2869571.1 hypothetical protein [Colwellia sp. E2M01]
MSSAVLAMPKISIKHQRNTNGFAQVQVQNETTENLLCHIEIDGYKLRFRLKPRAFSNWHTATDTRFNHTHFSVWCDYLRLYPQHQ